LTLEPRFTRQSRLAEVGEEGQARLLAAVVQVAGEGTRAAVESRYLTGAGVAVDRAKVATSASDPPWLAALHPAAREVAAGAHAALDVVRAVLADRQHPRVSPR